MLGLLKKRSQDDKRLDRLDADLNLKSETAKVTRPIHPDEPGQILWKGVYWRAKTLDKKMIGIGQRVKILSRCSSTALLVTLS